MRERLTDMYVALGFPLPVQGAFGIFLLRMDTGGGATMSDLELFVQLRRTRRVRRIFGIGNSFGFSTLALASLFPGVPISVMDAESEGRDNRRGSNMTRAIARRFDLPVHLSQGFSPLDTRRVIESLPASARLGAASATAAASAAAPRANARKLASFDLVFIDGAHTNRHQSDDFESIRPFLAPQHVVILHDVILASMEPSLKAIAESVAAKEGSAMYEYEGVNYCNHFGTMILETAHAPASTPLGSPFAWPPPLGSSSRVGPVVQNRTSLGVSIRHRNCRCASA